MLNKRNDALAAINELVSIGKKLQELNIRINTFKILYEKKGYQAAFAALETYASTASGDAGATDAAPVLTHPIAGAEISADNLYWLKEVALKVSDCLNNVAVPAADRISLLNQYLSGYGA